MIIILLKLMKNLGNNLNGIKCRFFYILSKEIFFVDLFFDNIGKLFFKDLFFAY